MGLSYFERVQIQIYLSLTRGGHFVWLDHRGTLSLINYNPLPIACNFRKEWVFYYVEIVCFDENNCI